MRRLALLATAALVSLPAGAAPSFYGFAAGAFIQGPESGVAVPNVVGQASSAAADTILEGVGLDLGAVTARCSSATSGQVVDQYPPAGTVAALASLVAVSTSNGTPCKGKPRLWLYLETQR